MLIARDKKYTNLAEYILYMYQLEDVMRACDFNESIVEEQLVRRYNAEPSVTTEITAWYRELIMAMKDQKIEHSGHLQYLKAQVAELSELNLSILQSDADPGYTDAFKLALPALSDIVVKSEGKATTDMEAAFTLLYGVMVLRMKKIPVSEGTAESARLVVAFMRQLVKKYHEQGKIAEE